MSFDQLSATERQATTTRRQDDPEYRDDPEFQKFSEDLSVKLFSLTSNISHLSQQVHKLGTKNDGERVRRRVHDLLEEAREGFKEVGDGIKRLSAWDDLNASQKYTQSKLMREFQSSGTDFQTVQRLALEKQRASASAGRAALDSEDQQPYSDDPQQEQHQLQEQEQLRLASQGEVEFQESMIIEREEEIRTIEQSVGELNELFRDVAHMVREQGEVFDHIESNVQNTAQDTRNADLELRSASRYQQQARSKMCCLLVVLVVILLVIILAVVLG